MISLVVVVYDMARETPRTLLSLSDRYQLAPHDAYEVIVVDNGSPEPLAAKDVAQFGKHFRLVRIEDAAPSPVSVLDQAIRATVGDIVGVMIDGARVLTPGVLHHASSAFRAFRDPVVATKAFHLGPKLQHLHSESEYGPETEDALLEGIGWPEDGYRLFEIAVLAGSSAAGWFWPMAESNCVFLRRETYERVGGLDPRFTSPGGGLANLDFYRRCLEDADTTSVVLLGEGSFHQVHGGVATGGGGTRTRFADLLPEYEQHTGRSFSVPDVRETFLGWVPPSTYHAIRQSADLAQNRFLTPDNKKLGWPGF